MNELTGSEQEAFRSLCDAARAGELRLVRAFKKDGTPVAVASRVKKAHPKLRIEPIAVLSEVSPGELSLVSEEDNSNRFWRN